jgi:DNA-binding NtrC family response regulator
MTNVMFVDDDNYMLQAYQRMLRGSPFHCFLLPEPASFWQQHNISNLQIVVADQQMPQVSGTELLLNLQHRYPAIKRVLISGDIDAALGQANSVMLDAVLSKPCSKATLLACLHKLCAKP